MCIIKAIRGDITTPLGVQAIVNAANHTLLGGGGVDGAIHRVAGPELLEECKTLNGCNTGEAKITRAYNLPCEYVIHTVGPIWHGGIQDEPEALSSCYYNSLKLAEEKGIRTIAFPSISTGIFHFPVDLAAKVAVETVSDYIRNHEEAFDLVEWVLFDMNTDRAYQMELEKLYGMDNER